MSSHTPTTAYLTLPIRLSNDPADQPPEELVYLSVERLTFQPSHPHRRTSVDAILYEIWGVTLDRMDWNPYTFNPDTLGVLPKHLIRLQPLVQRLLDAGIQPPELERVLTWVLSEPVRIHLDPNPPLALRDAIPEHPVCRH